MNLDFALKNKKSELVIKNCKIVNVFTNEINEGDVAISDGKIVGIGSYSGQREIDIAGKYLVPGFIDSHVHIESSMLTPREFAKAVILRGTTTVIADPHEIANVSGVEGIEYMIEDSKNLDVDVFYMLPSCVPCSLFETSGASLSAEDLEKLIGRNDVLGLGELMDYPGVINKDEEVLKKLALADKYNKIVDGHAPNLKGESLNAYILSGVKTDHECSTVEDMINKLRLGMYVLIREGSAARDLEALIGAVNIYNYKRCMFCTDDKHLQDILENGHIDNCVRLAIKNGLDPILAIAMATINSAQCYNLKTKGAVAIGYDADLLVVDDLNEFNILSVVKSGKLVVENKELLNKAYDSELNEYEQFVTNTVNFGSITTDDIAVKIKNKKANIIKVLPRSLVTRKLVEVVSTENNLFKFDKNKDILKIVVVERHKNTGNIFTALINNFKLKNGAIASTIAHDSHNIIAVGDNDVDILNAIEKIKDMDGGICISQNGSILDSLQLEIGGLMTNKGVDYVYTKIKTLLKLAYEELDINRDIEPFMTLGFMALPVICDIKITDRGLFDVLNFEFIDISAD